MKDGSRGAIRVVQGYDKGSWRGLGLPGVDRSLEGWAFSVGGPKIRFGFWWKGGGEPYSVGEFWGVEFRKPSVTGVTRGAACRSHGAFGTCVWFEEI